MMKSNITIIDLIMYQICVRLYLIKCNYIRLVFISGCSRWCYQMADWCFYMILYSRPCSEPLFPQKYLRVKELWLQWDQIQRGVISFMYPDVKLAPDQALVGAAVFLSVLQIYEDKPLNRIEATVAFVTS